jgi:peptide/nickel transport system substrate-binding protein
MSSNYGAFIMSTEGVSQESDWFNEGNEAGTGPYTIASYTPNESVELARYDDYWGGWSDGQFDTAEIQLVEDPVLAEQMVRNGDADFTYNLPFDSYAGLEGVEGLSVVRGESMQNLFGLLNHERLSPEVREALVLSFPYDDVVEAFYGGESTRSQGIIPQAVWGSSNSLDLPETDLDAAAKVLADAGVTDLSVTYSFDAGTTEQQQFGEVWRANLATIGVDLVLDPLTFDARWELAQADPANAQDVFTLFWFPTFVTPYDFMFSLFRTEEAPFFNLGYYSNPDFDALIDEADAVSGTDRDAAIALFQEASQILIDDNAAVFMVDVPNIGVINSDVSGYVSNPAYSGVVRFYDLTHSG